MKPNPYCPKCYGRGHYRGPWYGDFEPRIVDIVCEDCVPHSRPTWFEVAIIALGGIVLFILMLRGAAE